MRCMRTKIKKLRKGIWPLVRLIEVDPLVCQEKRRYRLKQKRNVTDEMIDNMILYDTPNFDDLKLE